MQHCYLFPFSKKEHVSGRDLALGSLCNFFSFFIMCTLTVQDLVGLSPFLFAKDSECLDRVCGFSVQPAFKRVPMHFIYFIPATVQSSKTGSHSSFRTWTCFSFFFSPDCEDCLQPSLCDEYNPVWLLTACMCPHNAATTHTTTTLC